MGRYHVIALMLHMGVNYDYANRVMDNADKNRNSIALVGERMIVIINNDDNTYTIVID